MSINPVEQNITQLFSVTQQYYIDFYQRDYKWDKEHIEKLLEDLFYRFELEYDDNQDVTSEAISKYDWYYLNAYVTNDYKGKIFIVDGQQRLTTLTLILIKLFHLAKTLVPDRMDLIKKHIYGVGIEGEEYWMGFNNREEALKDLFENGKITRELGTHEISITNLYNNYEFIDNALESYLNTSHKYEAFLLYFLTKVILVKIHIDTPKDVPMVFEVINDRGERLKSYEVLKGKLLGQIDKSEVDEYNKIWEEHIHKIQGINDKEVDNFFRIYFRSRFVNTHAEYREFDGEYHKTIYIDKWNKRIQLKQNIGNVKCFIKEDLKYYSELYFKLLQESEERENAKLSEHLLYNSLNDQDRQHLLILASCDINDANETEKIRLIAKLFDRHFTISHLTGCYDSNKFTESILNLNNNIKGMSVEEIKEIFHEQLINDISSFKGIEIKSPFEYSYFKDANNRNLRIKFIRYFFARIQHFIADNCNAPCDSYYNLVRNTGFVQGYHVEHIIADNKENKVLFEDEELFHQERNRLGALTLLKGRDNLSSGYEPYLKKLETYSGKANLLWTQSLREDFYHCNPNFIELKNKFNLNFRSYPDIFDKTAVDERQKLLFDIAKIIWD